MIADGLVEEVRALRGLPRPLSREAAQALGYKELFDHLDGRLDLEEAVVRIQTRSRNFAKRQLTWFRNLAGVRSGQGSFDIRRVGRDNRLNGAASTPPFAIHPVFALSPDTFPCAIRPTGRSRSAWPIPLADRPGAGGNEGAVMPSVTFQVAGRDRQGPHLPRAAHPRHHRPRGGQRPPPQRRARQPLPRQGPGGQRRDHPHRPRKHQRHPRQRQRRADPPAASRRPRRRRPLAAAVRHRGGDRRAPRRPGRLGRHAHARRRRPERPARSPFTAERCPPRSARTTTSTSVPPTRSPSSTAPFSPTPGRCRRCR